MQKYKTELFLIIILLFFWEAEFFILDIWPCLAQTKVEITEVMYDLPGNDLYREWIEIYNTGTEPIDLIGGNKGWRINDGDDSTNHTLKVFGDNDLILQPQERAILADKPEYFLEDYPNFPGKIIDTVLGLKNSSNTISIIDPDGNIIDGVFYNSDLGAAGNGKTLEKNDSGLWQESLIDGGTPGLINSCQQNEPQDTPIEEPPINPPGDDEDKINLPSPQIIINELFPNPVGKGEEEEFIELKNLSDFMVYLVGWQIKDKSDKTYNFILEKIPPQGLLPLFYKESKIHLNNIGGEVISLYDNYGNPIDSMSYQDTIEGYSYNFTDQGWLWSSTPTPGDRNIITTKTEGKEEEQGSSKKIYPRHIWINEFLPNPEGKDTEGEFIELYNPGPNEIDLEDWQLDDKEDGGSRPYTFPENSKIGAGEYLTLPYSQTKIALNNDEDWVRLLWPEGEAIDELQYESPPPGKSFNKHFPNWCWSDTPTPSEQNICSEKETEEEAQNYPRSLWINEFLPDPKGKDTEGEFIELQNRGDEEIELAGWQLDDREDGGSRPYTFPKNPKIAPGSYLVIYYQDSKIALNNDGDWVRLLNPNGEAIDEIEYPKAPEGKSYSRQNISSWQWTENPTPGKDNEFTQILAAAAPKSTSPSPLLPQTGPNLQFYLFSLLFFILPIFFFPKRLID